MGKSYIIYADVCCLNRPLDIPDQPRVRLEAEAMLNILKKCEDQEWQLISSDVIRFEISRNNDPSKREKLETVLSFASVYVTTTPVINQTAQALMEIGFKLYDALHLSFAQAASADIFLTTDDRLLRKAKLYLNRLTIPVENPVIWFVNKLQEEDNETV